MSASLACWWLDPIPDFLKDHTLVAADEERRLPEHAARWVQFVGSLWNWHDRATFALRHVCRGGTVQIFLVARAHSAGEQDVLSAEVEVLLRAHRLLTDPVAARYAGQAFQRDGRLRDPAVVQIAQMSVRGLWAPPRGLSHMPEILQKFARVRAGELEEPSVIFPWAGPGGPFLLPFESLVSQSVASAITVCLQPTQLRPLERGWLTLMAREAKSQADQSRQELAASATHRVADPAAELAGKLYMTQLRRLGVTPFLVTVLCAAEGNRLDAAMSLAGTIQALVHEPPFERPLDEENRLPSGARLQPVSDPGTRQAWDEFAFPRVADEDPTFRMGWLVDPQGAATVFRLPVSVRGGVPGVRVRQLPPDFHPGPRLTQCPPGHLSLGKYRVGGGVYVPVKDLTKHTLVTGFTGSGKTVTVMQLLHQAWVDHQVPFLVLESAKQEYRGMTAVRDIRARPVPLRVYTLGNETCVPLRLNPFELLPGVRVEAHISQLQTCFEAAIPPIGPSASILFEALLRVYEARGWALTDVRSARAPQHRLFPRMRDFARCVEAVLEERKYEGEVRSNLRAALVGRFQPLLIGGKGLMFDCERSSPELASLFEGPVVLELNDLNLEDKALVTMFLLALLREHRERNRGPGGVLKHLTLIEEAHNLLEEVASSGKGEGAGADTRYKTVQAFCQLLTEIRALGEGLIIADQSPEKLARDALRNTNIQIAHQLRDANDRDAIARAMIMEEDQRDYLGKQLPGHAALFRTGLEKATFIQIDKYAPDAQDLATAPKAGTPEHDAWSRRFRGYGFEPVLDDATLRRTMEAAEPELRKRRGPANPFDSCAHCTSQCQYRDAMVRWYDETRHVAQQFAAVRTIDGLQRRRLAADSAMALRQVVEHSIEAAQKLKLAVTEDLVWCSLVHAWHGVFRSEGWEAPKGQPDGAIRVQLLEAYRGLTRGVGAGVGTTSVAGGGGPRPMAGSTGAVPQGTSGGAGGGSGVSGGGGAGVVWELQFTAAGKPQGQLTLGGAPMVIGSGLNAMVRIASLPEVAVVATVAAAGVQFEDRLRGVTRVLGGGERFTLPEADLVVTVRQRA